MNDIVNLILKIVLVMIVVSGLLLFIGHEKEKEIEENDKEKTENK